MPTSGFNLQSLSPDQPNFFYDDTDHLPTDCYGHIITITGGVNFNAGTYWIYQITPNFAGKTLIQLTALIGSSTPAQSGTASGGAWSITYGETDGAGVAGTNLMAYPVVPGYFIDPDSQPGEVVNGSEITVGGGTGFTSGTLIVSQFISAFQSLNLLQLTSKDGSIVPSSNAYGGSWSVSHYPNPSYSVVTPNTSFTGPINLGMIGDSITALIPLENHVSAAFPNASSTIVDNLGAPGSRTGDWLPGQTSFANAVSTANSHGWTVVNLMLGTNDSVGGIPVETYLANMQLILDGLFAQISTLRYVVIQDILSPEQPLSIDYNTALTGVGHRATLGTFGDYELFLNNPDLFADSLHPISAGADFLAEEWMMTLLTVIPEADAPAITITTTESTLERGEPGQTLHVQLAGATSTSTSDFTLTGSTITAGNFTDTANPVLTVTASATTGTLTLTHVPSGATCTITDQDTTAPSIPSGLTLGTPTAVYALDFNWSSESDTYGGSVTFTVKKNGSTVQTGISGTSYSFTGLVDGDVLGVEAVDPSNNASSLSTTTFHAPTTTGGTRVYLG
jgi:hypothetical protein